MRISDGLHCMGLNYRSKPSKYTVMHFDFCPTDCNAVFCPPSGKQSRNGRFVVFLNKKRRCTVEGMHQLVLQRGKLTKGAL